MNKYYKDFHYNPDVSLVDDDFFEDEELEIINSYTTSTRLSNHLTPTSKVYKQTLNPEFLKAKSFSVSVGNGAIVHFGAEISPDHIKEKISDFGNFDSLIHDAIATFYKNGVKVFTPKMVIRHLKECDNTYNPPTQLVEDVSNSINKMRHIDIMINFAEQKKWKTVKESKNPSALKAQITNYMLPLKIINLSKINNNEVETMYGFIDVPPLLDYSEIIKQVDTSKRDAIVAPYSISANRNIFEVIGYIHKRITDMKSGNKRIQSKILWKTIFKECDLEFMKKEFKEKKLDEYIANQLVKDSYIDERSENESDNDFLNRLYDCLEKKKDDNDFLEYYENTKRKKKKVTNNYIDRKRKSLKNNISEFLQDKKDKGIIKNFEFHGTTTTGFISIEI